MANTSFYSHRLNADTYDLGVGRGGVERDDIPFYVELARSAGTGVLELACGTGRVTVALAEAGFDVTGLDASPLMLGVANSKHQRLDADVQKRLRFVEGNMATFDLGVQFDAVFIPFRSFQFLLTMDDQRQCLERVRRHLRPGGTFAAQLFDPLLHLCIPDVGGSRIESAVDNATGTTIRVEVVRHPNDSLRQVLHETWAFSELGADGANLRTATEELMLRWTYRNEMRYLLELAGLEVVAEYSDFTGSPPAYGREQVWVARRPD